MYLRRLWMFLGALLLSTGAPVVASAQVECGSMSPNPLVVNAGTVDPFSASSAGTVTGSAQVTFAEGITKPIAIFVLVHPSGGAPVGSYSITDTAFSGNLVTPSSDVPSADPANGDKVCFTGCGNNPATWSYSIPLGSVSTAGTNTVSFDVQVACKGTGDQRFLDTFPGGLKFTFTVLNALKAGFAGSPLNFGDITNVTSPGLTVGGAGVSMIKVQSMGAYGVTATSANNFVMTPNGVPVGSVPASSQIGYTLTYLGKTGKGFSTGAGTNTTFPGQDCQAAGISASVSQAISATLDEPGHGKDSGAYSDIVTLTFTPDNPDTDHGSATCNA